MPYYLSQKHPDCKGRWAVVNKDYGLKGCHGDKQAAIRQMVAISIAEKVEPGGTWPAEKKK
jgi:hypothetical protein